MLGFARFFKFDGAQFWILLFIITAILSETTWYVLQFDTRQFHALFRQVLLSSECHLHIFDFLSRETNPRKIYTEVLVRQASDWSWRCQRGFETFTYPPAFFLPLVFENFCHSFIDYSIVTFGFDPCTLLPTGYRKRTKTILFGACSDIKKWLLNW